VRLALERRAGAVQVAHRFSAAGSQAASADALESIAAD
jgi:hypothetical protein